MGGIPLKRGFGGFNGSTNQTTAGGHGISIFRPGTENKADMHREKVTRSTRSSQGAKPDTLLLGCFVWNRSVRPTFLGSG
jgi:hypothetical protein